MDNDLWEFAGAGSPYYEPCEEEEQNYSPCNEHELTLILMRLNNTDELPF
jgi:hypothetical protein